MLAVQYDKWLTAALPVIPEAGILLCQHITEVVEFKHSKKLHQRNSLVRAICFLNAKGVHCEIQ